MALISALLCTGKRATVAAIVLLATVSTVRAATISNLFNTGVDNLGNALVGAGVPDPHYSIIVTQSSPIAVTADATLWPIFGGPWVPNNANSRWISPAANMGGPAGNYVYRTTFTLPASAQLNTVNISGLWATDDAAVDIYINNIPTGSTNLGFTTLVPFNISGSGLFQVGLNTLDFELVNAGGPTGLRVDQIVGKYVPEPSTLTIICLSGLILASVCRRPRWRC